MADAMHSSHPAEARRKSGEDWNHRIPVEILDRVFSCLRDNKGSYNAVEHNPNLMGVCRLWYEVVANNPAFWNVSRLICLNGDIKPGFEYWIRIPKTYTLNLTLFITPKPLYKDLAQRDIWKQEVSPYLERMRTLCIKDCYKQSFIIFPRLREIAARATRLTDLTLQSIHNTPAYHGIKDQISVQFPALQFLSLVNWVGIVPQLTCPDLRSFRMEDCDFIPSRQVWWMLQASPRLNKIELDCCTFDLHSIPPPKSKHELQHLRDLSFTAVDCEDSEARYVEIGKRLIENAPSLTRLQLSIYTVPQLQYVPPAKVTSHLSTLRIQISCSDEQFLAGDEIQACRNWLYHLLVPAEKLEVLALESLDPMDLTFAISVLILGDNENESAALCRNLKSFEVKGAMCDPQLLGRLMVERAAPLDVCQRMGYSRNIGSKFNHRGEFTLTYFSRQGHDSKLDHVNWEKYVHTT